MYGCGIDHEDEIWGLNYFYGNLQQIFLGFENLNLCKPNFLADIVVQLRHVSSKDKMVLNTGRLFQAEIVEGRSTSALIINSYIISALWAKFWSVG